MSDKKDKIIGKFQQYEHPTKAENYDANLFIKKDIITVYSKILRKEIPQEQITYHCPRCDKVTTYPYSHGDSYECCNCQLRWQTYGNSIYVWDPSLNFKKTKKSDNKLDFLTDLTEKINTALKEEDYEFLSKIENVLKEIKL